MEKQGLILCVDDEPNILRSLKWLLSKHFEVRTANSGHDALLLVKKNDFDVVISDQRMPGMTGSEFLHEVRKISPRSMRLLLTGYSDMNAILGSVNSSEIYRFIKKPWDMKTLVSVTANACNIAKNVPALKEDSGETDQTLQEAILILDDDKFLVSETESAAGQSTQVIHTDNLLVAVTFLSEQKVGIFISNTHIRHMEVSSLLKIAKQNNPGLVCIATSKKTDADMVIKLINEGQIYRFIPKPVKAGYINVVMKSALNKRLQLSHDPSFANRYSVEKLSADKKQVLQDQIKQIIGKSEKLPDTDKGIPFVQRISRSLGRLFGQTSKLES